MINNAKALMFAVVFCVHAIQFDGKADLASLSALIKLKQENAVGLENTTGTSLAQLSGKSADPETTTIADVKKYLTENVGGHAWHLVIDGNDTIAVTDAPTTAPTSPTNAPTPPTNAPTSPTNAPTSPTNAPTPPTNAPTSPTNAPTSPTSAPTPPTNAPTSPPTDPVPHVPYTYLGCYQDCDTTNAATFGSTVRGNRVCDDSRKRVTDISQCAPHCKATGYEMFAFGCPTNFGQTRSTECWCCNLPLDDGNARIPDYECYNGPKNRVGDEGYDTSTPGFSGITTSTTCMFTQAPHHMESEYWVGGHCRLAVYFTD